MEFVRVLRAVLLRTPLKRALPLKNGARNGLSVFAGRLGLAALPPHLVRPRRVDQGGRRGGVFRADGTGAEHGEPAVIPPLVRGLAPLRRRSTARTLRLETATAGHSLESAADLRRNVICQRWKLLTKVGGDLKFCGLRADWESFRPATIASLCLSLSVLWRAIEPSPNGPLSLCSATAAL